MQKFRQYTIILSAFFFLWEYIVVSLSGLELLAVCLSAFWELGLEVGVTMPG